MWFETCQVENVNLMPILAQGLPSPPLMSPFKQSWYHQTISMFDELLRKFKNRNLQPLQVCTKFEKCTKNIDFRNCKFLRLLLKKPSKFCWASGFGPPDWALSGSQEVSRIPCLHGMATFFPWSSHLKWW